MRIAIGAWSQETNTFSPVPSGREHFVIRSYETLEELVDVYEKSRVEISGFLHILRQTPATILPLITANAGASGGALKREAFDSILADLLASLREAGPVDAVLLSLHGALVIEDHDDAEGCILQAVRELVGPHVPIAASLDLHGHITPLMIEQADILVGYQEYPHIDMFETGEITAKLLLAQLQGEITPHMAIAKRPMLVNPVSGQSTTQPMRRIMDRAREMEASGQVICASLFPVQPWLDVADLGFAALVVAQSPEVAQAAADELADLAWQARAEFEPDFVIPLDDAIMIAMESDGVTVVGDPGDAPSSGAAADNPSILRALLAHGVDQSEKRTYLSICDAPAAQQAAAAGIGAEVTLRVGHSISRKDGEPLEVHGKVLALNHGLTRMQGPGATGAVLNMGLTAVLAIGDIRLVIRSLPASEWDPAIYLSVGLFLNEASLIFVKSPAHFRVVYGPIAGRVLVADTPGAARANMGALDLKRVTRPLFPLDQI